MMPCSFSSQDVIEELIGTEIVDETDQFVDNLRSEKVRSSIPWILRVLATVSECAEHSKWSVQASSTVMTT